MAQLFLCGVILGNTIISNIKAQETKWFTPNKFYFNVLSNYARRVDTVGPFVRQKDCELQRQWVKNNSSVLYTGDCWEG